MRTMVLVYLPIYLQNWVILDRANVGIHIPAPWFAYGNWFFQLLTDFYERDPMDPRFEFEHAHKLTVCYWKWPFFSEFSNGDFPVRFLYVYHFGYLSGSVGSKKSSVNHHFLSKKCQTWRVGTAISMDIVGFQFRVWGNALELRMCMRFLLRLKHPRLKRLPREEKKCSRRVMSLSEIPRKFYRNWM